MLKRTFILLVLTNLLSSIFSQTVIGDGLVEGGLIDYLQNNYKTSSTLGYNSARDVLYGEIDKQSNGNVYGIYTDYYVNLPNGQDPSTYLYNNGMNCEHVWPQSLYSGSSPMKSDMHHLQPCKENVNSSRSNKPFGEINDYNADHWYWQSQNLTSIPSNNIDEYSESSSQYFEPREDTKGDIARSMFYFYTMYESVADDSFFELQKETLFQWHQQDPATQDEIDRTWAIANYQENKPNPYILDATLVERAYFFTPVYGCTDSGACNFDSNANTDNGSCEYVSCQSVIGDVSGDLLVNVLDIILVVNHIIDAQPLIGTQLENADLNQDSIINVLDIIEIVNIIITE